MYNMFTFDDELISDAFYAASSVICGSIGACEYCPGCGNCNEFANYVTEYLAQAANDSLEFGGFDE